MAKINLGDIYVEISLKKYEDYDEYHWGKFDVEIKSPYVNYSSQNREHFMMEEVDHIIEKMEQLLEGKIHGREDVWGLENDIMFTLIHESPYDEYRMKISIMLENKDKYYGRWSIEMSENSIKDFLSEFKKEHEKASRRIMMY